MKKHKRGSDAPHLPSREELKRQQAMSRTDEIRKQAEEVYDVKDQYAEEDRDEYDEDLAAKKAGLGCLIAFLVVLVIVGGILLWGYLQLSGEINGKNATATASTVEIDVGSGAGGRTIGIQLKELGMIGNETIFRYYVRFAGSGTGFQVGNFKLTPGMSYDEIIETLSTKPPPRATKRVTFPEGRTVAQFGAIMEKNGLCTAQEFIDEANNGDFSDIEFFSHLEFDENTFMKAEGYLAPDTYDFFVDDTVHNMVRKLYEQFNDNLEAMTFKNESGVEIGIWDKLEERELSLREVVTLASMVEEEAGDPVQQPAVAGVFWNRLTREGNNIPRTLGSDVTYYYLRDWIAPSFNNDIDAIPRNIFYAYYTGDEDDQSRVGLPAGPISNPSKTAIEAALNPAQHDYFYFLTDFFGVYYYAEEFWEHEQNIATMDKENARYKAENGSSSSETTGDGTADAAGENADDTPNAA